MLFFGRAGVDGRFDGEVRFRDGLASDALQTEVVVMDLLDAAYKRLNAFVMALLAGFLRGLERTRHPVRRVLLAIFAHVRHMAVDAGDAVLGMDACRPDFEVRMLRFEHHGLGIRMFPVALELASLAALVELELFFRPVR